MKALFIISFLTCSIGISAQSTNDTIQTVFYLPGNVNVTVHLKSKGCITGDVWRFTDTSLMMYGRSSAGGMVFKYIHYAEMHCVRIKRYAFAKGMIKGGTVGSYVGDHIMSNSYADYKSSSTKAWAQSTAVIASGAVIGGVLNNAVTKKKFKINGSKQNYGQVFEVLLRAQ